MWETEPKYFISHLYNYVEAVWKSDGKAHTFSTAGLKNPNLQK